nr:hypothetical protein [Tanacetum cinerariifolium]
MSTPTFAKTHNLIAYLEKPTKGEGSVLIIDFLNGSSVKYALTVSPTIHTSCINQFWTLAKVKKDNDEVQIQALIDGKRVNIKDSSIRRILRLDDAEGTGFSREVTPLFDNILVQALEEVDILQVDAQPIHIPTEPSTSKTQKKHKPKRKHTKEPEVPPTESQAEHNVPLPSPSHDPLPSGEDSLKLKELIDLCTNLSNRVLDLESEVIDIKSTFKAKIEKLESRVERLEDENRLLKELKGVHSTVDSDEPVMEKEKSSKQERKIADIDADVVINLEKTQAEAYNLDLDDQEKVLSVLDVNDEEPGDVEEVLEVVTTAKLITGQRKTRKGKNRIKTGQKREAWRSREKSKAVTVKRARKTEENAKRRAKNANPYKVIKEIRKKGAENANISNNKHKGQNCKLLKAVLERDHGCNNINNSQG